ncbi:MAG: LysM peptidoglycan-binding domain-containing protein [Chloroflexota bacterium]
MNFIELLKFIPLIIGAFLAYHLIFKLQLPSKNIGAIFTYFLGILIVFLAVSWLITTFLPDFANDLLDAGRNGDEWNQFIQNSEDVVDDAFSGITDDGNGASTPDVDPTAVRIITVTVTPDPNRTTAGEGSATEGASGGPTVHTVMAGDTLLSLSRMYGVSVENIRAANGIPAGSDLIHVGQELIIPAR